MRLAALAAVLLLAVATGASGAQLVVGAGATLDLGTGSLHLGCARWLLSMQRCMQLREGTS